MSQAFAEMNRTTKPRRRLEWAFLGARAVLAGIWLFASLVVLIPFAILAGLVDPRHRVYDWCSRVWARGILLMMGVQVVCQMPDVLFGQEPYVVVANHQGALDIPALVVAFPTWMPIRFVAKRSLYFIPILGWGMRLFGHIKVDCRTAAKALLSLGRAQCAIRSGRSVVFFAEGTRTRDGRIGPFKKGAFRTAVAVGARVLPVTITGSWETLPRDRLFPLRCGTIRVAVHAPLAACSTGPGQVQMAAEACRRQISLGLSPAARERVAV